MQRRLKIMFAAACILSAQGVSAQTQLDRADPSIVEQALPKPKPKPAKPDALPSLRVDTGSGSSQQSSFAASAIVIDGAPELPRSAFSEAILPFIGRALSGDDLSKLAGAVGDVARKQGYPFATAWIDRQKIVGGVLRVQLDAGKIAAVRVIGAINPLADRILTHALVSDRPVHRSDLERAILLVGDLPGLTVKDSKYIRQDGFGILLVTVAQDRASAYVQVDNRGSREVGPIRSTILANLRGVIGPGDELGVIVAQTPFQPSEFAFGRLRYTAPVGSNGATLSASGSYGLAQPGAGLAPLEVKGRSYDGAVNFSTPLVRSRAKSLWANLEIRALRTKQALLGFKLRDDQLATATASVNGFTKVGPGTLRAEISGVAGLPFAWVTHEEDRLKSRNDGDARFATIGFTADWTTSLSPKTSLVVASQGQLASRPLLASMELGNGGPTFGRGYDYAERTGDNGILGSVELRTNVGTLIPRFVDRTQFYGFFDGGRVSNLRGGLGGGGLLSTGAGARLSGRIVDAMVEVALPLNKDRFDTRNRDPRISFRLSKVF